jgi:uncharacterized protein YjiS (DUF1127 family)
LSLATPEPFDDPARNDEGGIANMAYSDWTFEARETPPAWAALRRLAAWPFRVAAARAAMHQLGAMNDRELADIGLTRQDLRDATALPAGDDPTRIFAMRVDERKSR